MFTKAASQSKTTLAPVRTLPWMAYSYGPNEPVSPSAKAPFEVPVWVTGGPEKATIPNCRSSKPPSLASMTSSICWGVAPRRLLRKILRRFVAWPMTKDCAAPAA